MRFTNFCTAEVFDTQVRCQLGIGDARIVTHQSGDASVSVLERVDAAVAIAIY